MNIEARTSEVSASRSFMRSRRLRANDGLRGMVRETRLSIDSLVYPLFVKEGHGLREPIPPMPGCFHLSPDRLEEEMAEIAGLGIRAVLLFGIPSEKDGRGTGAYDDDGIVQEAVRLIKGRQPGLVVATDVCMCEYTDHGHCGIVLADGTVDNDATLELLAQTALSQARAGADIVAPSAMMDGQVSAIRRALDADGFTNTAVMGYSAKYASVFYGPFRVAAESVPQFGDRRAYQMDPPNAREALREIEADVAEGADIVMVKPALAYLDVIARARGRVDVPIAAYNVSGEYSMVKAAAANGWLDERRAAMEVLLGIRRAGADIIITYHARDVARWLTAG